MGAAIIACYGMEDLNRQVEHDDMELFLTIHLTRFDIARFVQHFRELKPAKGTIDIYELVVVVDIDRTKYKKHAYKIFDQEHNGRINLRQFVLSLWNYCTLGEASLVVFTFDLYDSDGSGRLDSDEISKLMLEIYGAAHSQQITRELQLLEENGGLDIKAFTQLAHKHPNLLFSAFNLQSQLRKRFMGEAFWQSAAGRRVELSRGEYVTMGAMMQLHLDQELYDKMVAAGAWKNDAVHMKPHYTPRDTSKDTPKSRLILQGQIFRATRAASTVSLEAPRREDSSLSTESSAAAAAMKKSHSRGVKHHQQQQQEHENQNTQQIGTCESPKGSNTGVLAEKQTWKCAAQSKANKAALSSTSATATATAGSPKHSPRATATTAAATARPTRVNSAPRLAVNTNITSTTSSVAATAAENVAPQRANSAPRMRLQQSPRSTAAVVTKARIKQRYPQH